MKPSEKANELANKFISKSVFDMTDQELKLERKLGKKYALICVDEILSLGYSRPFYDEVKHEINLL